MVLNFRDFRGILPLYQSVFGRIVRFHTLCEIARPKNKKRYFIPMFPETIQPLYIVSGFAVGFLVGMTGVGGGSLMTPLLILLFKVNPVTAVGTDLIYAAVTKSGGSLVHGLNRTVDWRVVGRLAAGSIPASLATMALLWLLDVDRAAYSQIVTKVLGVALLLTAGALLMRRRLLATYASRIGVLTEAQTAYYTVIVGLVLGVMVTVSSVGAGALGVTALLLLYPDLPVVKIAGSDIAHAVPLTLVAGLGHLASGGVDMPVLVSLLMGSLPGIMLSSLFAPRLPDTALRLVLAVTLVVVALRLLVS
jgi:uncharacterized membrane protein YfcA